MEYESGDRRASFVWTTLILMVARVARPADSGGTEGTCGWIKRNVADKWAQPIAEKSARVEVRQRATRTRSIRVPMQSLLVAHALGHSLRPTAVSTVRSLPQLRGGAPGRAHQLRKQTHGGRCRQGMKNKVELAVRGAEGLSAHRNTVTVISRPTTEETGTISRKVKSNAKPKW